MKYLKQFESSNIDQHLETIESILDDHLDEFPEAFTYTITEFPKRKLWPLVTSATGGFIITSFDVRKISILITYAPIYDRTNDKVYCDSKSPIITTFIDIRNKLNYDGYLFHHAITILPERPIRHGKWNSNLDRINNIEIINRIHKLTGYKVVACELYRTIELVLKEE